MRSEASKHRHTIAQALRWLATGLIWAVTVALVLDRFGVPFTRLAVPATVVGVALGVGAQQVVKDLIGGIFIIAEHQYGFGDMVRISGGPSTDGATGVIEDITLRITRVRTPDGEVVMIPNGQVLQVTNLSRDWARAVVDVPLAVGVDVARANEVLRRVGASAFEDQKLRPLLLDAPTVMGSRASSPAKSTSGWWRGRFPESSSRWPGHCARASPWPSSAKGSGALWPRPQSPRSPTRPDASTPA